MYYIPYVEQQNFLAVFDEAESCSCVLTSSAVPWVQTRQI